MKNIITLITFYARYLAVTLAIISCLSFYANESAKNSNNFGSRVNLSLPSLDDTYEAENGQLFDGATINDCENCSNGKKVGNMGGDNKSYFTYDVEVTQAGIYNMPFTFISGDQRSIFISVNDGNAIEVACKSADWSTTGETELEVTLDEGTNSIRFFNDNGYAPDIDKFSLNFKSPAGGTIYEAEEGTLFNSAVISDCESCSGSKKVGGMGGGGENNGYFTYDVNIDQAGNYRMPFTFVSGDERSIYVSVNNGEPIEVVCKSADWSTPAEAEIAIAMESGINTVKFFNDEWYAPDIDKFSLIFESAFENERYEAEDGTLFNSAVISDCGTCSEAKKVGGMGGGGENNGYFTYDVEVTKAGTYNMPFGFVSGDERTIFIAVNDQTPIEVVCKSPDWGTAAQTAVEISLSAGSNTIKFFNDSWYAPDIDYFELEYKQGAPTVCETCSEMDYGQNEQLVYNKDNKTFAIYHNGSIGVNAAYSEVKVNGEMISSKNYQNVEVSQQSFSDDLGDGVMLKAILTSSDLPEMHQLFYSYSGKNYLLMDVEVAGINLSSNYMAPLISQNVVTDQSGDNRVIRVPYDNDAFVRYESEKVMGGSRNVSSEVTAYYENNSRHGLITGSVEHTVWKSGVETKGSGNTLELLKVWGGYTSSGVTRDELEHGNISGSILKSPKVFIGYYDDWRTGMEDYGTSTRVFDGKYIKTWNQPTPFGWNSWGSIQTDLNLENAKGVVDFFADEIPLFRNGETAYIDLDSYWDNMVDGGLEGDFSKLKEFVEYCKEHNLKPGIYWAPFVDWGLYDRPVEGSSYNYSDVWTDINGGFHDEDGARAMDPTHPATKDRINLVIDKFKEAGFEMLKIDFIAHASVEATSFYNPDVTTGMQAFKEGMEYLSDRIGDDMLIYAAISPNIATGRYAHMRRIACDAYSDINATEYTLNSNTYGWWQDQIYDYIDADMIIFDSVSEGENRARLASAVVNGTVITADDFSEEGPWTEKAKNFLQNQRVLDVARAGVAFIPVEGDTDRSASELFVQEINGKFYVAAFNYGDEKSFDVSLDRLNIVGESFCVKELFSGNRYALDSGNLTFNLPAKDAAIFEFNVGVDACVFSLPDNFNILSTNVTCNGKADGKINIDFADTGYHYILSINGEDPISIPENSSNYQLDQLTAGTYDLCFRIEDIADFEQCFEIVLEEPGEINATAIYNRSSQTVSLKLQGADRFYVRLNGLEKVIAPGSYEFPLQNGMNDLQVKGDLECQGAYFDKIYVSEGLKVYPNPTQGRIQVYIPSAGKKVDVTIFNMQGGLIQRLKKVVSISETIEVDLGNITPGTYLMRISNNEVNETIKVIKQ